MVLQNENSTGEVQVVGGDTLANLQDKVRLNIDHAEMLERLGSGRKLIHHV